MLEALEKAVLQRYTKAVCHLNYAFWHNRKLGFILGAGVSKDLRIPDWKALLNSVERIIEFDGRGDRGPEAYRGEQLFQYYRNDRLRELVDTPREIAEARINSDWRQIVSNILYAEYLSDGKIDAVKFLKEIRNHLYLPKLAKIASDLELVITHNFDNALELAVDAEPTNPRPENRRYNAFWRPDPFLRQDMLNVYHPNGYSPSEGGLKGSDSIILTEASFADQLANTNTVESNFLLSHMSNKTWLLIGHSLADGTLKNVLRLHANRRPGHINYYIHYTAKETSLSDKERNAIREANFSTYNLFTFFLNSSEIAALLSLVGKPEEDLYSEMSSEEIRSRYTYYICGTVSSGKSTILSHLRSMATVEEWPDKMPQEMNKPSTDVDQETQAQIDAKLEDAIWRKDQEIGKTRVGIVAVDRAPLDFIAFPVKETDTPFDTARSRHEKVLRRLKRDGFEEGQVILVESNEDVLLERQIRRGRRPTDEDLRNQKIHRYLARQQELMREIYRAAIDARSTVRGDCCSVATCLQDVIRIIYFGDYQPFNFKARLKAYLDGQPNG